MIDYQKPELKDGVLYGLITANDEPYSNIWTSIPRELFEQAEINLGDNIEATITYEGNEIYKGFIPCVETLSKVEESLLLCNMDSEPNLAFAINRGNFSEVYKVFNWVVTIIKVRIFDPCILY